MDESQDTGPLDPSAQVGGLSADDRSDIDALIRVSDQLRARSHAAQRAAARASVIFSDAMKRSRDAVGKIGDG